MEFRLLGPVECVVAGTPLPLGRPQERCLLAVLLADLEQLVSVDRLVELLWDGEPPARARTVVHTHVSRLRSRLRDAGAERYRVRLVTRGQGYLLDAPPDAVDAHRFRRLADTARQASAPAERAAVLGEALGLWRGPAIADVATERVREQICAGLDELRLAATEDRAEAGLALGRYHDVVTELTGLAARHPLRERTVGLLMLAQYRSGQQARALATYRATRRALVEELGIDPGAQLRRLEQAILTQDPALDPDLGTVVDLAPGPHVIPARTGPPDWAGPRSHLTSIVGRDREAAELSRMLDRHRLITVVGVGGVGKTVLALHAAELLGARRAVAVGLLAAARSEDDVGLILAEALGVHGTDLAEIWDGVRAMLTDRPHLLVLDNCEHLVAACGAVVRRLLRGDPRLVVLATSRQPLALPEETVWRLAPLDLPDPDAGVDPAVPAVALFLRRAAEAAPGSAPDRAGSAVTRICRRVDGLPLALELAAGRLRTVPVEELAAELEAGLGQLRNTASGNGHRLTLTAAVDWSYRLLTDDERRLLARLSVFRDGFDADLAAAVCGAAPLTSQQVPAMVARLADRSLIQGGDAAGRYRMLEVIREYAAERLAGYGERAATEDRHFAHWLRYAREVAARPRIDDQYQGWERVAPDLANLRGAVEHAYAAGRIEDAVDLTILAWDCLTVCGALAEQERWLDRAWPHLPGCPPRLRTLAQLHRALLLILRDEPVAAERLLRPLMPDLAVHDPLSHQDAEVTLVRCQVSTLDPAGPAAAVDLHARLRTAADAHIRLHSLTMAVEALVARGQYEQACRLCDRDGPSAADLDAAGGLRYDSVRGLAELGAGNLDAAEAAATRLRGRLTRPAYIRLDTPAYTLALIALATGTPAAAQREIVDLIALLDDRYPATISRRHVLALLLAEAHRRAGNLAEALDRLAAGLDRARSRTNYHLALGGVLTAAALAADLGELDAARRLADRWDALRGPLGLPAPLGFVPTAHSLGLDPDAPTPIADPGWSPDGLRDLMVEADAWCRQARRGRPVGH